MVSFDLFMIFPDFVMPLNSFLINRTITSCFSNMPFYDFPIQSSLKSVCMCCAALCYDIVYMGGWIMLSGFYMWIWYMNWGCVTVIWLSV
ncbi:hypothetical protein Lalb_Chr18g0049941 [Lupinus albus]|uniref:Uncharacterized protein n=1 Tax=Lupinus albus TaxID=3870 RepID=A0A6A4P4W2_LUPAL|nr:hypothetical protein Lalb_Chr18g0049941 [Lupinus albus]